MMDLINYIAINPLMVANIIMFLSFMTTTIILILQLRLDRNERSYTNFIDTLKYYDALEAARTDKWAQIKKSLLKNPKTKHEVHDTQNTLSYLMIRISQKEPLYGVEYELIQNELESLNFLNQLCKLSQGKQDLGALLILKCVNDISYYQSRKKDLLKIYDVAKKSMLLPRPNYHCIDHYQISDYFNESFDKSEDN